MIARFLTSVSLMGAVAVMPLSQAEADTGDFVAGAIVGIAGAAIVNDINRNNQRTRTTTVRRAAPSGIPRTERGAQTQTALNYFGYNAGPVDGQIGSGTRAAIERYQIAMGYPVNGRSFPDYQFENLMAAYYWAEGGGQSQTGLYGQQLLMAYKNQQQQQQPVVVVAPQPQPVVVPQPQAVPVVVAPQVVQPQVVQPQPAPETIIVAAPAEAPNALPNFLGTGEAVSLAGHCNTISLQTNTNGGFTNASSVTDPNFALSEQFCLARTYAVETGQDLAGAVTGVSASQIEANCGAFGSLLSSQIASLTTKDRDAVVADVANFVVQSGQQPASLAGTAKICLGVGYRTDDMTVALGSALILTAVGEGAYGELMGHHLSQSFGVGKSAERAKPWYDMGITAAEAGDAVFAPGQPERTEVIRAAMNGGSAPTTLPVLVPVADEGGTALPTFSVNQ
ncbi:MAG: peptidoglycan-binding domain-containing protein [Pseudomonadota bacterium]